MSSGVNRTRTVVGRSARTALRPLWRRFAQKPWASPTMEVQYGLWNGVSCLYSAAGRQLGEASARPYLFNDQQSAQWRDSRYGGARAGVPINVSALRIAMDHFDQALTIVGAVRAILLSRENRPFTDHLGVWDLYFLSRFSVALIAYGVRSGHMIDDQKTTSLSKVRGPVVPTVLATQFQFISGIFMICRHMIETGAAEIIENTSLSASALYEYADQHGVFLSPSGGACAGSRASILQFLQFCIDGEKIAQGDGSPSSATSAELVLTPHVGDVAAWLDYGTQTIALECTIDAAISGMPPSAQAIFAAFAARADALSSANAQAQAPMGEGAVLDLILARQNAILARLGRPPIKAIPAKMITVRMAPVEVKDLS
ncbi:MAG: hypothetical protein AAFY32_04005 [Pseudomonadota bacterium]